MPSQEAATADDKVDFQRQIRPLLADKCFACHGRDAEHREGGLRLDERDAALKGGDSEKAGDCRPASRTQSELVRRILSTDDGERMPPPESKKSLTTAEKDLLRRWIAEGAEYQAHWAFTAPGAPRRARSQATRPGRETTSTASSWPGWRRKASRPRPQPIASRCCAG